MKVRFYIDPETGYLIFIVTTSLNPKSKKCCHDQARIALVERSRELLWVAQRVDVTCE